MATAPKPLKLVFKVLPILLLLADSLIRAGRMADKSRLLMSAALLFSAIGDVAGSLVTMGIFFSISHCFYIVAYSRYFSLKTSKQWICITILLVMVGALLFLTLPRLLSGGADTKILIAGCIYVPLLTAMPFSAISQSRPYWILFAIGSLLFVISDSIIFIGTFAFAIPARHLIVMSTYYGAQLLMNLK